MVFQVLQDCGSVSDVVAANESVMLCLWLASVVATSSTGCYGDSC